MLYLEEKLKCQHKQRKQQPHFTTWASVKSEIGSGNDERDPRYMDLPIGPYSQSFWKSPQCSTQQTIITLSKVSKIEKRCGISYTLAFPCNAMCVCAQLCAYIHLCSKEPRVSMSGVFLGLSLSNLFFWNEVFHRTWGINKHPDICLSLGLRWQTCAISHGFCVGAGIWTPIWTASPSSTKTISHVPSCSILSGVLLLGWNDWIWDIKWGLTPYSKTNQRLGTASQPGSQKRSLPQRLTE